MKKYIIVLLLCFSLSACSSNFFGNNATNILNTNNGNIILVGEKDYGKLCSKGAIDTIMMENSNSIENEFSISKNKRISYQKDKEKFKRLYLKDDCDYEIYYYDYYDESNYSNLKELSLKDNSTLSKNQITKKSFLKDFMNNDSSKIVDVNMKKLIVNGSSSLNSSDLKVESGGKYVLRAYPAIRYYHLVDKKKIYDFDLVVLEPFKLELVKK